MYHNRYAARHAERHPIITALAVLIFGPLLLAGLLLVGITYVFFSGLAALLTMGKSS